MDSKMFDEQFEKARKAGDVADQVEPRATAVYFNAATRSIRIELRGDRSFSFPADQVEELAGASDDELSQVEITPNGEGLRWAGLDVDLSVPGLIEGCFGPPSMPEWLDERNEDLLNSLYAEIETTWNVHQDDGCVDRLAREHPDLAGALYSFFTVLIENDLSERRGDIGDHSSSEDIRRWLESEGFTLAADAANQQRAGSTFSSEDPPSGTPVQASNPDCVDKGDSDEGPPTFLRWLVTSTGRSAQEVAEIMGVTVEFLMLVMQHIDIVLPPVREELANRAEARLDLNGEEARASLNQPYHHKKAAFRSSSYPTIPLTFDSLLKRAGLKAADRKYWKKIASGKV